MAEWDLNGRVVLVTGAARGIGAESARQLAARGARVALVGLEPAELERVAGECRGSVFFEADVTDHDALAAAVDGTVEALGGIDAVVANAGVGNVAFVRSTDPDAFERVLEVNLVGVWRTVRACLPHVIERRGYVLNVASSAAIAHLAGMSAYAASKAGVEAFSNALRIELRPLGVDVGVAYFNWIDTDMVRGADANPLGARMRGRLKGPVGRTRPVGEAAAALVDGVAGRARIVAFPRFVRAMLALRGMVQPLMDLEARRHMAGDDRFALELARERGADASAPVGAGGAADRVETARR
jgi:NAD(P)-dependent dehydrogenase (short-subunit alcohol dehydrogenase family)